MLLGPGQDNAFEFKSGLGRGRVQDGSIARDRLEAKVVANIFGGGFSEDTGERLKEIRLADNDASDGGGARAAGGGFPAQARREGIDFGPSHGVIMRIGVTQFHHRQGDFG